MVVLGLMSFCDIIALYSEINDKCIKNGEKNKHFKALTRIMFDVKAILKKLKIRMTMPVYAAIED
jgi:hypothetical protein